MSIPLLTTRTDTADVSNGPVIDCVAGGYKSAYVSFVLMKYRNHYGLA
jgi:hypothetical protein